MVETEENQRTHYVPQWLLAEFKEGPRLCSFNLHSALISTKASLYAAGSGDNLWPKEIEKEVMAKHDQRASTIFQRHIRGRGRILLSDSDRWDFALWLALFMPRVPNTFRDLTKMIREGIEVPEGAIKILYERRAATLAVIQRRNPEVYAETVRKFGKELGEEMLLAQVADNIRNRRINVMPTPEQAYHAHLASTDLTGFASVLCEYDWVWLYSRQRFVIGDNPLVRWHVKSGQWNYGIRRSGVEITIPLGTHLGLRLERRHWKHSGRLQHVPRKLTREYNRRQRLAATGFLYAATPELLKRFRKGMPDDVLKQAARLGMTYQPPP